MQIEFRNVIPYPIKNEFLSSGELWGKNVIFDSSESTLIDAHSGKGKSTFTSIVAGLRFDFEGHVLIDKKKLQDFSKNEWTELRKSKFSFIFQDLQLFDKLTVEENLILKNSLTDFKSVNEIKEFIELFEMENKWKQSCGTLSLGQQQRVAIIRSLLQPAEFLIMDEPFSHLDELNTEKAILMIKKHCVENDIGIILTSLGQHYNLIWDKRVQIA